MQHHLGVSRPEPTTAVPAATAVGALLAPVVACLRDDDNALRVLFEGAREDGTVVAALAAAPAVVRVYLRLAPRPDGVERMLTGYVAGALDKFRDREIVAVGSECLEVARASRAIAPIADAVFVDEALTHGRWCALVGAIASCWWCAERSAELRGTDPIEETTAICHYLARAA
jgi:hypothetical protein